jgi:hypothetical protein
MKPWLAFLLAPVFFFSTPLLAAEKKPTTTTTSQSVITLGWPQLVPDSERARLTTPSNVDHSKGPERPRSNPLARDDGFNSQEGNPNAPVYTAVKTWSGKRIRIAGYIVPVDYNSKGAITSFFLVPYFGACIHLPPPPPNQIIYVRYPSGFSMQALYEPFWVTGMLKVETMHSEIAESLYTLQGNSINAYTRQ